MLRPIIPSPTLIHCIVPVFHVLPLVACLNHKCSFSEGEVCLLLVGNQPFPLLILASVLDH